MQSVTDETYKSCLDKIKGRFSTKLLSKSQKMFAMFPFSQFCYCIINKQNGQQKNREFPIVHVTVRSSADLARRVVGGQRINKKQTGDQMSPLTIWLHFRSISPTKYRQSCWPDPDKQFLPLSFKTRLNLWKTSTDKRMFNDNIAFTYSVLWAIFSQD